MLFCPFLIECSVCFVTSYILPYLGSLDSFAVYYRAHFFCHQFSIISVYPWFLTIGMLMSGFLIDRKTVLKDTCESSIKIIKC